MFIVNPSTLYIVATPIGDMNDITLRAKQVLASVDCIAAEDTRHSGRLLNALQIQKPMISLHDHNEQERALQLCTRLQQGQSISLISDAGTPLISDPGYKLVQLLQQAHIAIVPIPGACAAITALCASGLPTDRFVFEGFLPAKSTARQHALLPLKEETRTLIFYEAPHRLLDTLADLCLVFGATRRATVARELTKHYETIYAQTLGELSQHFIQTPTELKGEVVLMVHGYRKEVTADVTEQATRAFHVLAAHFPVKQAVQLAAEISGESKNKIYAWAVTLHK